MIAKKSHENTKSNMTQNRVHKNYNSTMIPYFPQVNVPRVLVLSIALSVFLNCVSSSVVMNGERNTSSGQSRERTIERSIHTRQRRNQQDKMGQLESFSFKATGLGDLEASDALKKMNRRSSPSTTLGIDLDNDTFANLQPLIEKRRKSIVRNSRLIRRDPYGRGVGIKALIENDQQERQAVEAARELLSLNKMSLVNLLQPIPFVQNKEPQLYALQKVLPTPANKIKPIILARRTKESLDPSNDLNDEPAGDDSGHQQFVFSQEHLTPSGRSSTIGEFGSKVSLLTTRKVQPNSADNFDIIATYGGQEFNEEDTSVEESEPITSQILISPRPNVRLTDSKKNPEDCVDDKETKKAMSGTTEPGFMFSMDQVNQNYLPRIARALM